MTQDKYITPDELFLLAVSTAIFLTRGKSADEINVLGNFIVVVGSLLLVWAAEAQFIASKQEEKKPEDDTIQKEIEEIKKRLLELEDKLL